MTVRTSPPHSPLGEWGAIDPEGVEGLCHRVGCETIDRVRFKSPSVTALKKRRATSPCFARGGDEITAAEPPR